MKRFWIDGVCSDSAAVTVALGGGESISHVMVDDLGGSATLTIVAGGAPGGEVRLSLAGEIEDVMVIREPRRIVFTPDGMVMLTILDYIQLGSALSAIPAKLGEFEARIAALEGLVGLRCTPVEGEVPIGEGTGPSGEGE